MLFDELPALQYLDNLTRNGQEVFYEYDDPFELSKQDGYICSNHNEYKS